MSSEFVLDTYIDMPDDDDMPPLVERPPPPPMSMMSYSFDADFTPILYSPDSPQGAYMGTGTIDMAPEPAQRFELISEEDAPRISATGAKPSHAKKRDAGHIPRPPNAFILFRSSFIKSESVPGNIEGNHSTLSKIIGIVWKTLPPAEREQWEKRAVQAQAEHRARYPDWRFRPGTNIDAIAKRKTKDKNKDQPPARRRRNARTRDRGLAAATAAAATTTTSCDGDRGGGGGGGGGRNNSGGRSSGGARRKGRGVIQERRCAQIAELLARGVKGVALTSAVQAWDKESGASNVTDGVFISEQGMDADADASMEDSSRGRTEMRGAKDADVEMTAAVAIKPPKTRSASSAQQARFNVPLTAMYRRASSVPLVPDHAAIEQGAAFTSTSTPMSVSPVPDLYPPPPLSPASSVSYGSEVSFPDSDNMSVPPMFDFVPFSPPGSPCSSNADIGALGIGPSLAASAVASPPAQAPEASLQNFFSTYSTYSTLCDWAGNTIDPAMADGNHHHHHNVAAPAATAKVVLPPLSLSYGCFGLDEVDDHPFSFLPATHVPDPWHNEHELLVGGPRPLFGGGLEDAWTGARSAVAVTAPYA